MPPPVVVHGVHKEKGNVMNSSVKKCRCGRSETGICNGSHSLTEEEYKKKKNAQKSGMSSDSDDDDDVMLW